jgi:hypothetical protein
VGREHPQNISQYDLGERHRPRIIDGLIIYCFRSRIKILHLHGDVTTTGEWQQNLGVCSALRAFEQGGIFIVPWALVFLVSFEEQLHSVTSHDTQGDAVNLF